MLKRIALSGLTVLGIAFATSASAQESSGAYLGASIGEASVEVDEEGVAFDGSDTAFKVFGGYAFNEYVALELAWFDAGKATEDYSVGPVGGSIEVELSGFIGSVVGRLPVGESFALFGKLGFASYDGEVSAVVNGQRVASEEGSDEDVAYGVGGEFTIGERFGLRAEYEIVDASDAEFNVLSVGASWHF